MMYMRAHGSSPGPTQRPWLAGSISGGLATLLPIAILTASGAVQMLANSLGLTRNWLLAGLVVAAVVGGALYSRLFGRAVNDMNGGWLFGIACGFLLWMIGPTVVLQWFRQEPVVAGTPAAGVFAAHLVWGLILGFIHPPVHRMISRRSIPKVAEPSASYTRDPQRKPSH